MSQKKLDRIDMALIGGKHKSCLTMLVCHIDINSLIKIFRDPSRVATSRSRAKF
jgi:hypothetical protein